MKGWKLFIKKDNQFAVECFSKIAENCSRHGEFFDNEEDASDWVEDECWIFSGEFWICIECNTQIMRNLVNVRRDIEQEKKEKKGNHDMQEDALPKRDNDEPEEGDLFKGIPTVL